MNKLYKFIKDSGLEPNDFQDEDIKQYIDTVAFQLNISPSETDKTLKQYTKDFNAEIKRKAAETKRKNEERKQRYKQDKADAAFEQESINMLRNERHKDEDRDIKLSRIREDNSTKSLSGIAKALGLPVPDELFKSATTYTRASEDTDRIKKRAEEEKRELTEEEQKKLETLEETMAKTKGAHELLQKIGPTLSSVGVAATGLTLTIGALAKMFEAASNAGKRASARIDETQTSMSAFGEILNVANTKTNELERSISVSSENIGKYVDSVFSEFYTGFLTVTNGILNGVEWLFGVNDWVGNFLGDNVAPNSAYGQTGGHAYDNDPYFQSFLGEIKKAGYGRMFTEDQLYSYFGATADAMIPYGHDLDSISAVAQRMLIAYGNSDRYDLDIASGVNPIESLNEIMDLIVNGGVSSRLGINLSDTYMAGFKFNMGIPVDMKLSDAREQELNTMAALKQLGIEDRAVWAETSKAIMETGMVAKEVSGRLLDFDQANVLGAINSSIPDVGQWQDAFNLDTEAVKEDIMEIPNMFEYAGKKSAENLYNPVKQAINSIFDYAGTKVYSLNNGVSKSLSTPIIGLNSLKTGKIDGNPDNNDRVEEESLLKMGSKIPYYSIPGVGQYWLIRDSIQLGNKIARNSYASGGLSIGEQLALVGDNPSHRELHLPLGSPTTTTALAKALTKAGAGSHGGNTYHIVVHLDGVNIADNDNSWNMVANKIKDVIDLREQRGG